MENPDVVILQSQVTSLQMCVSQLADMLRINFPNMGLGSDVSTHAFAGTSMSALAVVGRGPAAYQRWLRDPGYAPQAFVDYPGKFNDADARCIYQLSKTFRECFASETPFGKSMTLVSKPLSWVNEPMPDGFYHVARGGYEPVISTDRQGVLLSSGEVNKTRVFFPFGQNVPMEIQVYINCEDRWVVGERDHIEVEPLIKLANDFLTGSGSFDVAYRPSAVETSALTELFEGVDLDAVIGPVKPITMVYSPDKERRGTVWTNASLDPLSYVKDHSLPHQRYVEWGCGTWSVWICLDEDRPRVQLFQTRNWGHDIRRENWEDLDTTSQWRLYDQIRADWIELLNKHEAATVDQVSVE